jgi:hypothetical protein
MRSMKRILVVAWAAVIVGVMPGIALAAGPLDGLTIPPRDPALVFLAPTPDQPNYAARLDAFLASTVPDTFAGQPVQFLSSYVDAGGVDLLGVPTSAPKADPNNPSFIYQRFQNGVLFYNGTEGTTSVLPLSA